MASKNNVVSILLFVIYSMLLILFVCTILFGGQKIGGAIYFIFFAISVAFAFLDRKYHSSYINLYRYSAYLSDIFNIIAISSILYYQLHAPFMIAILCVFVVSLLVDILAKNRLEKRRFASICMSVFNCVFMFTIFPYFFVNNPDISLAVVALVTATLVMILKIVLAVVPYKEIENPKENKQSLETKVSGGQSDHDVE